MKFAIIFHETPEAFARRTGPDAAAYWSAWSGYFVRWARAPRPAPAFRGPRPALWCG